MNARPRGPVALGALGAILLTTASWWSLALWQVSASAPAWLLRTRAVCFGVSSNALPDAGGWLLLIGQPLGMLGVLVFVWPEELGAGFRLAMRSVPGQVTVGVVAAAVVTGLASAGARVIRANDTAFSPGVDRDIATHLTRVRDEAPALDLVDQYGRPVTLEAFRGRPVLITFAYAHCQTICPLVVADVLTARRRLDAAAPPLLVITLDPWRDTPSRLEAIAREWRMARDEHLLSGSTDAVERTLNAWRVPRVRNPTNGALSHPAIVYVLDKDGRIAFVVDGNADTIAAAVRAL